MNYTEAAIALFCPHCGALKIHPFTRFNLTVGTELLCCCGQPQGRIVSVTGQQLILSLSCVLCAVEHKKIIDLRQFWHVGAERLYCDEANIEMGFFGDTRSLREMFDYQKSEFERISAEDYEHTEVDNPPVMFEIFNCIHDLAAQGAVGCRCGAPVIEAELFADSVMLFCRQCGSGIKVPALTEGNLAEVRAWKSLWLVPVQGLTVKTRT